MEILLEAIITIIVSVFGALLPKLWPGQQGGTARTMPRAVDRAAYEMAYRGMLHEQAGKLRKCRRRTETGKAWLRQAAYQHRKSARTGQNDAINDIKAAITASAMIDRGIRPDQRFLESEINAKLHTRIGNRPAAQILQTQCDAVQTAALYQRIITSQMRSLKMISSVAQYIGGVFLFTAAALLLVMIPRAWSTISGLPPETFAAEWLLPFWIIYAAVSLGFLGGGIALLFSGR